MKCQCRKNTQTSNLYDESRTSVMWEGFLTFQLLLLSYNLFHVLYDKILNTVCDIAIRIKLQTFMTSFKFYYRKKVQLPYGVKNVKKSEYELLVFPFHYKFRDGARDSTHCPEKINYRRQTKRQSFQIRVSPSGIREGLQSVNSSFKPPGHLVKRDGEYLKKESR